MSSIAYVTDSNMIEFHRLNGNNKLNFWRPSNSISFADFQQGDLLFFLAKGTEKNKEKGIIGYGSFDHGLKLSPNQAWRQFGSLNGYHAKEDFFAAITKVNKKLGLPKQIGCLCLIDVVYFQEPLYLSSLGYHISKRLQSYTYLDKENGLLTQQILEKAKLIGVDMWSMSVNEASSDISVIEQDQIKDMVSRCYEQLKMGFYTEVQQKKLRRFMKESLPQLEIVFDWIKGSKIECYSYEEGKLCLLVPLLFLTKDAMTYGIYVLGRLFAYESYLASMLPYGIVLQKYVVVLGPLEDNLRVLLETHHVTVLEVK